VSRVDLDACLGQVAAGLTDEELLAELQRAERHVLQATRCRREMALQQVRCLRRELARRGNDPVALSGRASFSGSRKLQL
jgi:hypothetical protein